MLDYKQTAARTALGYIQPGQTIGLGAGATIAHLVGFIHEDPKLAASLRVVTSSFNTKVLLEQKGFAVLEMTALHRIDTYFDGCDQFDRQLNALKSGGGIHTREKILASMADTFILAGDEAKYSETLDGKYPLVVEVIPDALSFVLARIRALFEGVNCQVRLGDRKDGAVITENGNFLIDCRFGVFPEPALVNDLVIKIPGVLEHSLFYGLAKEAILAGPGGITVKKPQPYG